MEKKSKKMESDGTGAGIGFLLSILIGFYLISQVVAAR